jgi:hypothetical protein
MRTGMKHFIPFVAGMMLLSLGYLEKAVNGSEDAVMSPSEALMAVDASLSALTSTTASSEQESSTCSVYATDEPMNISAHEATLDDCSTFKPAQRMEPAEGTSRFATSQTEPPKLHIQTVLTNELLQHGTQMSHLYTDISSLRTQAKDAFLYAYDKYIEFGYPHDEVKPISCEPRWVVIHCYRGHFISLILCRVHWDRSRGTLDDTLGGYMTTLVDSLDTLLMLKEFDR